MCYGDKIRFLRMRNNMSLCELAKASGISKSTLSNIENNCSECRYVTLSKICNTLNIDSHLLQDNKLFDDYVFNLYLDDLINSNYVATKLRVDSSKAKQTLVSFMDSIILNN